MRRRSKLHCARGCAQQRPCSGAGRRDTAVLLHCASSSELELRPEPIRRPACSKSFRPAPPRPAARSQAFRPADHVSLRAWELRLPLTSVVVSGGWARGAFALPACLVSASQPLGLHQPAFAPPPCTPACEPPPSLSSPPRRRRAAGAAGGGAAHRQRARRHPARGVRGGGARGCARRGGVHCTGARHRAPSAGTCPHVSVGGGPPPRAAGRGGCCRL